MHASGTHRLGRSTLVNTALGGRLVPHGTHNPTRAGQSSRHFALLHRALPCHCVRVRATLHERFVSLHSLFFSIHRLLFHLASPLQVYVRYLTNTSAILSYKVWLRFFDHWFYKCWSHYLDIIRTYYCI